MEFILHYKFISDVYNTYMGKKIRIFLAIVILAISCALLIWGLWPMLMETRVVPVDPSQMQLPTPVSFCLEAIG